jgi:hypothetical protein
MAARIPPRVVINDFMKNSAHARSLAARVGRFLLAMALSLSSVCFFPPASPGQTNVLQVNGDVALSSLASLSDGHLRKLADTLQLAAHHLAAHSLQWTRVRPALKELRPMNVASALWFALPNGSYWTLDGGPQTANLRTRAYFARLLGGKEVIGDLVVSKATKKAVAIVAVPIVERNAVVGALGASVYLDQLSAELRREMHLPAGTIFYSFDSNGIVALNWDKTLIFLQPRKVSADLDRAFGAMLAHAEGRETYVFRGKARTVLYRKSNITRWWYAFGFAAR